MRRGYTLIEFLIVVSILGILAAILAPVFMRGRENLSELSCNSNLKQIAAGLFQYAEDYDEHLPPAAISERKIYGWVDAVQPYIKSYRVFLCTKNRIESSTDSTKPNLTDYYLNRNLARQSIRTVNNSSAVILIGEGNDGHDLSNARYSRTNVPPSWMNAEDSPLLRHDPEKIGANYILLDGSIRYLTGTSIGFGFKRVPAPKPRPKKREVSP